MNYKGWKVRKLLFRTIAENASKDKGKYTITTGSATNVVVKEQKMDGGKVAINISFVCDAFNKAKTPKKGKAAKAPKKARKVKKAKAEKSNVWPIVKKAKKVTTGLISKLA